MNMETNEHVDMSYLLDTNLDDLDDMPSFKAFPNGAYRVTAKMELKTISNSPAYEVKLKIHDVLELANPSDEPPKAGDESNVVFMLKKKDGTKNQMGEGQLKEFLKPFAAHFNTGKIGDLLTIINEGAEFVVATKRRADKNDADKFYLSITNVLFE